MAYPPFLVARRIKFVMLVPGDSSITSTSWVPWNATTTMFDLTIEAAAGDVILATPSVRVGAGPFTFLDAVTLVSGSPVNTWSSMTYTAGSGAGVGGWSQGGNSGIGQSVPKAVVAGDIVSGQVTVRPIVRLNSAGTTSFYGTTASGSIGFMIENIGPVDPT